MRIRGEAVTVTMKVTGTLKIADREITCMMIGYADDHDGDLYQMMNPNKERVTETRDVIWLHRMFFSKPKLSTEETVMSESEEENELVNVNI